MIWFYYAQIRIVITMTTRSSKNEQQHAKYKIQDRETRPKMINDYRRYYFEVAVEQRFNIEWGYVHIDWCDHFGYCFSINCLPWIGSLNGGSSFLMRLHLKRDWANYKLCCLLRVDKRPCYNHSKLWHMRQNKNGSQGPYWTLSSWRIWFSIIPDDIGIFKTGGCTLIHNNQFRYI